MYTALWCVPFFKHFSFLPSLQAQQEEFWGAQVTVVSCDMREWNSPEKADILVSELLGSFGDNELSPECLDGAQKFLKGSYLMVTLCGSNVAPGLGLVCNVFRLRHRSPQFIIVTVSDRERECEYVLCAMWNFFFC
jgi:hypothetical protein